MIFWYSTGTEADTERVKVAFQTIVGGSAIVQIRARCPDAANASTVSTSTQVVPNGIWTHVVIQIFFTSKLGQIYVNGVLLRSDDFGNFAAASTDDTASDAASLAAEASTSATFYPGEIDDYRVYSRLLSIDEIRTIFASKGRDGIVSGLVDRFLMKGPNGGIMSSVPNLTGGRGADAINSPTFSTGILAPTRRCP